MKKLLFAVSAIAVLSLLLVAGSSIAEPTHPNEVGLYMEPFEPDGTGVTGTYIVGDPVIVYLVLTRPTDTETGIPYPTINAFECMLTFNPINAAANGLSGSILSCFAGRAEKFFGLLSDGGRLPLGLPRGLPCCLP